MSCKRGLNFALAQSAEARLLSKLLKQRLGPCECAPGGGTLTVQGPLSLQENWEVGRKKIPEHWKY